jgi:TolA-binding protein
VLSNDVCRVRGLIGIAVVLAAVGMCWPGTGHAADPGEQLDFADSLYVRKMFDMAAREYEAYLAEAADAPEAEAAYFRLGESWYNQQQYSKTARALTALLEKFPSGDHSLRASLRLGEVQYRLGNHGEAVKLLDRVVAAKEDGALKTTALYYLGQAHLAAGDTAKSTVALKRLINEYPKHGLVPYARFALATAYFEAKGFTNAAEQFTTMAETNALPSSLRAEATLKAGLAHAENKDFDKGAALFDRTMKEHPGTVYAEQAAYERAWAAYHGDQIGAALDLAETFLAAHADSKLRPGAQYLKGKSLQSLEKYADAESVYGALIKEFPDDEFATRTRCQMCWTAYWLKRFDVAEKRAGELYETLEGDLRGETLFVYGQALSEKGKFEEALAAFGEVIDKHPASKFAADAEFQLGRTLASLGKSNRAAKTFADFSENRPDHPLALAARLNAAQQEFLAGSFKDAAAHYAKLAGRTDDDETRQTASFMLGQAEHKAGRTDAAVKAYSSYVADFPKGPQAAEALYRVGIIQQQQNDAGPAVKTYRWLIAEYPGTSFATLGRRNLGYLLHDKGDLDEASTIFIQLLAAADAPAFPAETLLWLANHLFDRGDFADSSKAYTLYAKENGKQQEAQFARVRIGDCAYHVGDGDAAARAYNAVLKDAPEGPYRGAVHFGLGRVLLDSGKTSASVDEFAKAIDTGDTEIAVQARCALGDAYMKLKNFDDAVRAYMMVAMVYDHAELSPECYVKAAEALEAKGDGEAARKMYEDLINEYPKSEKVAIARDRLKR